MKRKRQEINKKTYFKLDSSESTIVDGMEENETLQLSYSQKRQNNTTLNQNIVNTTNQNEKKKCKRKNNQKQHPKVKNVQNVRITRRMAAKMKCDDSASKKNMCSTPSTTPQSADKWKNSSITNVQKNIVISITPTLAKMNSHDDIDTSVEKGASDKVASFITATAEQVSRLSNNSINNSSNAAQPVKASEIRMELLSPDGNLTPVKPVTRKSSSVCPSDKKSQGTIINNDDGKVTEEDNSSPQETISILTSISEKDNTHISSTEEAVYTELQVESNASTCRSLDNSEENTGQCKDLSLAVDNIAAVHEEVCKDGISTFNSVLQTDKLTSPAMLQDTVPCNSEVKNKTTNKSGDLEIPMDVRESNNGNVDSIDETYTPKNMADTQPGNISEFFMNCKIK